MRAICIGKLTRPLTVENFWQRPADTLISTAFAEALLVEGSSQQHARATLLLEEAVARHPTAQAFFLLGSALEDTEGEGEGDEEVADGGGRVVRERALALYRQVMDLLKSTLSSAITF